ncbi:MAG: proline dehydrogenase family protein [Deltaproteobacteria bacterium]|nr:proline dehydrogenase family protein [Deltaproteobacteria bacterium]
MKGLLFFFAKRYIAGTDKNDAIGAALRLNKDGILATIDHLGENVKSGPEAQAVTNEYLALLDGIKATGAASTVSLKLTHLGLDISNDLAAKNAETIIEKAAGCDNFVRFDMEGSAYTQKTLDIFLKLHGKYRNMGIAIQSYLLRSRADIELLIKKGASVRLVKGAYKEPPEIAFRDKKDVDKNFDSIMKELLSKGFKPAIATHDEKLIDEAKRFADKNDIPKDRFEFQMLLGIKRGLQKRLADEGYRVRVYVPYGRDWLPYTIRRLKERKENIYFVVRNIFD